MLIFTLSVSDSFLGTYHVIELPKISLLVQTLVKLAWIVTLKIQAYFGRTLMKSSEHNLAYISPPNCINPLSPESDQHQISPCDINAL